MRGITILLSPLQFGHIVAILVMGGALGEFAYGGHSPLCILCGSTAHIFGRLKLFHLWAVFWILLKLYIHNPGMADDLALG